jgi:hypothetical protein
VFPLPFELMRVFDGLARKLRADETAAGDGERESDTEP